MSVGKFSSTSGRNARDSINITKIPILSKPTCRGCSRLWHQHCLSLLYIIALGSHSIPVTSEPWRTLDPIRSMICGRKIASIIAIRPCRTYKLLSSPHTLALARNQLCWVRLAAMLCRLTLTTSWWSWSRRHEAHGRRRSSARFGHRSATRDFLILHDADEIIARLNCKLVWYQILVLVKAAGSHAYKGMLRRSKVVRCFIYYSILVLNCVILLYYSTTNHETCLRSHGMYKVNRIFLLFACREHWTEITR